MVLSQKKSQRNRLLPVPTRRSQSPSGCAAPSSGKKIPILQGVLCHPQGHETNVSTGPVDQVPLLTSTLSFVSQHMSLSRMLKDALSNTVPVSQKTVNLIDLSGDADANSHESCETLAACHSPTRMLPACSSSQIHSCHHDRALDSNVVRSVSLSSAFCVLWCCLVVVVVCSLLVLVVLLVLLLAGRALGCMWWGGRWAFSLPFFTHAANTRT